MPAHGVVNGMVIMSGNRLVDIDALEKDALRYRWLRARDVNAIRTGGLFAGMTPDNIVLNGEDLDIAIDAAMTPNVEVRGRPLLGDPSSPPG